jgi:hypothetical protein
MEISVAHFLSVSSSNATLLVVRWTPALRQVTMRESCFYKRLRNRSSHEAVSAEAQRDV